MTDLSNYICPVCGTTKQPSAPSDIEADLMIANAEIERLNKLYRSEVIITGQYAQRTIALTARCEKAETKLKEAEEQIEWDNDLTHKLEERAEKAEAERDKAIEDLKISCFCRTCAKNCPLVEKLAKRDNGVCPDYEWRGKERNDG